MGRKVIVLSLGGSLIIPPSGIDVNFLKRFKQVILKNCSKYKFIIVCGGGSTARIYASALKSVGVNVLLQNFIGISSTRMNARFMSYFFSLDPKEGVPHTLKTLAKNILKNKIPTYILGQDLKQLDNLLNHKKFIGTSIKDL